ncbi:MAG: alpha/beta hydrolase [Flavobacteriales bacterium]
MKQDKNFHIAVFGMEWEGITLCIHLNRLGLHVQGFAFDEITYQEACRTGVSIQLLPKPSAITFRENSFSHVVITSVIQGPTREHFIKINQDLESSGLGPVWIHQGHFKPGEPNFGKSIQIATGTIVKPWEHPFEQWWRTGNLQDPEKEMIITWHADLIQTILNAIMGGRTNALLDCICDCRPRWEIARFSLDFWSLKEPQDWSLPENCVDPMAWSVASGAGGRSTVAQIPVEHEYRLYQHGFQDLKGNQVVLFIHGYKGYAFWGCWALMGDEFAKSGTSFFRMDFSHNGTLDSVPNEISDLDRWSLNTYSREVHEVVQAVTHLQALGAQVILMGHSRGAGIAALACAKLQKEGNPTEGLIWLAGVSDFKARFPTSDCMAEWAESDKLPIQNGRTGETYIHRFAFYEDFETHENELNVLKQAQFIACPALLVHAEDDAAVSSQETKTMAKALSKSLLVRERYYDTGGHTMDMLEPWPKDQHMPKKMTDLLAEISHFLKDIRKSPSEE